jgi:hyperosmotically inducible protein
MKSLDSKIILSGMLMLGTVACSSTPPKAVDVSDGIRTSLNQANLKDVSVKDDTDKAVITLSGHVTSDSEKAQAESMAKSMGAGQVVSDEIAVLPVGGESAAKTINSDLDKGIEQNLDAALIQAGMHKNVNYDVKNGVVTLTGDVNSQARRSAAQNVAATVPNVQQVVNELQVKDQKATSTN